MVGNGKFSGWRVAAGCFIIMFVIQGGIQTFAVFMPSIIADTSFTLRQISLMSTFAALTGFISNMLFGRTMKKIGLKWTIIVGILAYSAHFYIIAAATVLPMFYLGGLLGGFAIGFATVAPCSYIVTNWFVERRATVMSIVIAGSMFGGAIIMVLLGVLIEAVGWRMTYVIQATSLGLIALVALLFLLIESPSKKNQLPYGVNPLDGEQAADHEELDKAVNDGIDAKVARRTPTYFLLLLGVLCFGIATNMENFLPSFWQSEGMSVSGSATLMGAYAFLAGLAAVILGRISDKMGAKIYVLATTVFFIIGSLTMLIVGVQNIALMVLVVFVFALGAKKVSNLTPPLVAVAGFGRKDYGLLIGGMQAMLQLGIALSNPVISSLQDIGGDYRLPFIAMAGLCLLAMIMVELGLKLAPYKKQKAAD